MQSVKIDNFYIKIFTRLHILIASVEPQCVRCNLTYIRRHFIIISSDLNKLFNLTHDLQYISVNYFAILMFRIFFFFCQCVGPLPVIVVHKLGIMQ